MSRFRNEANEPVEAVEPEAQPEADVPTGQVEHPAAPMPDDVMDHGNPGTDSDVTDGGNDSQPSLLPAGAYLEVGEPEPAEKDSESQQ